MLAGVLDGSCSRLQLNAANPQAASSNTCVPRQLQALGINSPQCWQTVLDTGQLQLGTSPCCCALLLLLPLMLSRH